LVAFVNEMDMMMSDGSNAGCFVRSFGLYVYAVFLERDYDMYEYGLQGTSRVKLCRLKLRVSENQIKVTSLTRQVGVA
jgi:hypothetical protein